MDFYRYPFRFSVEDNVLIAVSFALSAKQILNFPFEFKFFFFNRVESATMSVWKCSDLEIKFTALLN